MVLQFVGYKTWIRQGSWKHLGVNPRWQVPIFDRLRATAKGLVITRRLILLILLRFDNLSQLLERYQSRSHG